MATYDEWAARYRQKFAPYEVATEEREQIMAEGEVGKYPGDNPDAFLKSGRQAFSKLKTDRLALTEQVKKARVKEQELHPYPKLERAFDTVIGRVPSFLSPDIPTPETAFQPVAKASTPTPIQPSPQPTQPIQPLSVPGSRFQVEDGEIIDTKNREILSQDQFNMLATPQERAALGQQADVPAPDDGFVLEVPEVHVTAERPPVVAPPQSRTTSEAIVDATNNYFQGLADIPAGALKSIAIASKELDALMPDLLKNPQDVEDRFTYKLGKSIEQLAKKMFPTDPSHQQDFMLGVLPRAFGSMTGFIAGGVAGMALKAPGTAASILGAGGQGADQYEEAGQFKADEATKRKAFLFGSVVGATEGLPIAAMLKRYDTLTGGVMMKTLKQGGVTAAQEAIQEWGQQVGSNIIAQQLYDEHRSFFENAGVSAGAGGAVGAVTGLVTGLLQGRKTRKQQQQKEMASESPFAGEAPAPAPVAQPTPEETVSEIPPELAIQQPAAPFLIRKPMQPVTPAAAGPQPLEQPLPPAPELESLPATTAPSQRDLAPEPEAALLPEPEYIPPVGQVRRIGIQLLRPKNWFQFKNPEHGKYEPPSVTKGPLVLNKEGKVIDGTHRLREALVRGDTEIDVTQARPEQIAHNGSFIASEPEIAPELAPNSAEIAPSVPIAVPTPDTALDTQANEAATSGEKNKPMEDAPVEQVEAEADQTGADETQGEAKRGWELTREELKARRAEFDKRTAILREKKKIEIGVVRRAKKKFQSTTAEKRLSDIIKEENRIYTEEFSDLVEANQFPRWTDLIKTAIEQGQSVPESVRREYQAEVDAREQDDARVRKELAKQNTSLPAPDDITSPMVQQPRSELPIADNMEMQLRAEKAQADLEIAGKETGRRKVFDYDVSVQGGTPEVTGLQSAAPQWYTELTTGPRPLKRQQIETAIQKIIKDHGVDVGVAVERVKEVILRDREFSKTPWGEDADAIARGEWPSWMEKPAGQDVPTPDFALSAPTVKQAKAKAEDKQTSIPVPAEVIGSRPIIGRETTPEESPLFSKAAQEKDAEQTTIEEQRSEYPDVQGRMVDGLYGLGDTPNQDSIAATLDDYKILKGIKEVPLSDFESAPNDLFYAADDIRRTKALAEQIEQSGEVKPLIVVTKKGEKPYILEGAHRLGALHILGKKSFPAMVVEDLQGDLTELPEVDNSASPVLKVATLDDTTNPTLEADQLALPTDLKSEQELRAMQYDRIPEGTMVSMKAIRASTGEYVTIQADARTALRDLDAAEAKYRKLLECLES